MTGKLIPFRRRRGNTLDVLGETLDVLGEVGGIVDETRVTLAIYGPELDPEEITILLGCEPTHGHRKGERRTPTSPPFYQGAWLLALEGQDPKGPQELTRELLDLLPRNEDTWRELSQRFDVRLRYGIFMSGWNHGFELSHALMQRIAQLHATVDFDLYADDGE